MPQELSFLQIDPSEIRIPNENAVNPQSGAAVTSLKIPLSPGRSGIQPELSLAYNSSAGNSVFGMGWQLQGNPVISLSLKEGYPKYDGTDGFSFGGQELVPMLIEIDGRWQPRVEETSEVLIHYYRAQQDTSFIRLEKHTNRNTGHEHWRMRSGNNQVMIFGRRTDGITRVSDPLDPTKTFQWLLESQYDNGGNTIVYEYLNENEQNVDRHVSFEKDRFHGASENPQKYLKRILYGNARPQFPDDLPADQVWHYEVVFDYGDQNREVLPFHQLSTETWPSRPDPYSSCIAGFEQRTYRLCQRILMFHHFEELGFGPTLVGNLKMKHAPHSAGTTLTEVSYMRYKRFEGNSYQHKTIPPLTFTYSTAEVERNFNTTPVQSNANVPMGVNNLNYKWIDLYGEGLPGILFEGTDAWYFKPNLGEGKLGPQERVLEKPNMSFGNYSLSDFDGDGNLNLVILQGREAGYYEYNRDLKTWNSFKPFEAAPHIKSLDQNTQLLDISGDGRSDILTVEDDRLVWYPALGKKGFGKPFQIAKEQSNGVSRAPTIGASPILDFFFVDMNGSGLLDQVRIRNGRVEYWPNLGNGKFGAGIVMENPPLLDYGAELDASRIRLVDLDGSGTSDLLYIDRGKIRYWTNASGNRFLEENVIEGLPFIDNISSVQVLDFLGDGTACLVYSSGLSAHSDSPIHYLRLTYGVRPRLLEKIENSMGLETVFHYGYSGKHYLRDKNKDRPWMTLLPAHRIVVDKLEHIDLIANTKFSQRYEYHDGFFDGEERMFRGFCLVDQYDSDIYMGDSSVPKAEFSDPVCLRTWYHNGAVNWQRERSKGYYLGDTFGVQFSDYEIEEISQLGSEEFFDAIRSLAGQVIRTETYGLTGDRRRENPFQVSQASYAIKRLQPSTEDQDAVFSTYQRESLEVIFEEDPTDPRIAHSFITEVDNYGVPRIQASVTYPRMNPEALEEQVVFHITAAQNNIAHFDTPERYELGIEFEGKVFDLRDENPPTSGNLYSYETIAPLLQRELDRAIDFDEPFNRAQQARLQKWVRNYYWNSARTEVLPFESLGDRILPHHKETACFTTSFLQTTLGLRFNSAMPVDGHYVQHDGFWWQPSPIMEFADQDRFFLPLAQEQANGGRAEIIYDDYSLAHRGSLAILTNDSGTEIARNVSRGEIDYHFMAPHTLEDPNENISEVIYDPFGVVVLSTIHGSIRSTPGALQRTGHNFLSDYVEPSSLSFDEIIASPNLYLQGCTGFFFYELDSWRLRLPLRSVQLSREEWVNDVEGNYSENGEYQLGVSYLDGFGRVIQSKTLVEGGEDTLHYEGGRIVLDARGEPELVTTNANRWRTSGHTVFNNKQEAVKQYEPYFITSVDYISNEEFETFGQTAILEFDALGRQKNVLLPDGSRNRMEFTPWSSRQYDANDWVIGSLYEARIEGIYNDPASPENIALQKSKAHNNTPVTTHMDGLGRTFSIEKLGSGGLLRSNKTILDPTGNPIEIIDARNLTAFRYTTDMQGRLFYEESMDAGPKWQFINALDISTDFWDGEGVHQHISYDSWGRAVRKHVEGPPDLNHTTERLIYGEDPSIIDAANNNLFGQLVEHYDQAGLTRISRYDITGNVLRKERSLLEEYTQMIDWHPGYSPVWSTDSPFVSEIRYNALGSTVEQRFPDETIRRFSYAQSGALEQLLVSSLDGEWIDKPFVTESSYNARGQSLMTIYGNGLVQRNEYDPLSFRLARKRSYISARPGVSSRQYQNIQYTYDAVGNITQLQDTAQPHGNALFNAARINTYTYDAFYQLIEVQGRTHQAMQRTDHAHSFEAPGFIKGTRHINLSNLDQLQNYTRTYSYDLNGNMEGVVHNSGTRPSEVFRWRRDFWISGSSNRSMAERDLSGNIIPRPEEHFDGNGNLKHLPHLRQMYWNYQNQLRRAVVIERASGEHDEEYYVYGGDGQRIRKVSHRLDSGLLEITEKIYLDGCEIKRVRSGTSVLLERYTSDISDGQQRVAMVHRWTRDTRRRETISLSERKVHYHLSCHLGSSAFELGELGEIINYEEYFAFGGSSFLFGEALRDVRVKDYRYSGKECDDVTKLYYYGFRYYVPWLCRWLNPDPIGPEDGLNVYQFLHNNPINSVDEDGLRTRQRIGDNDWVFGYREDEVRGSNFFSETEQQAMLSGYVLAQAYSGSNYRRELIPFTDQNRIRQFMEEWGLHGQVTFSVVYSPNTLDSNEENTDNQQNRTPRRRGPSVETLMERDSSDQTVEEIADDILAEEAPNESSESNEEQDSTPNGVENQELNLSYVAEEPQEEPNEGDTPAQQRQPPQIQSFEPSFGYRLAGAIDSVVGVQAQQGIADFAAGFGSGITFGLTDLFNSSVGSDRVLNPNSLPNRVGGYAGSAVLAVATGGASTGEQVAVHVAGEIVTDVALEATGANELIGEGITSASEVIGVDPQVTGTAISVVGGIAGLRGGAADNIGRVDVPRSSIVGAAPNGGMNMMSSGGIIDDLPSSRTRNAQTISLDEMLDDPINQRRVELPDDPLTPREQLNRMLDEEELLDEVLGSNSGNRSQVRGPARRSSRLAPELDAPSANHGSWYSLGDLDEFGRATTIEAVINPQHLEHGRRVSNPRVPEPGIGYEQLHFGAHELGFPTRRGRSASGEILDFNRGVPESRNLAPGSAQTNRHLGPRAYRPPNMRPIESAVAAAINNGGQTVRYRVTAIYDGASPYPSAFHMQASGTLPNGNPGIRIDTVIRNWTHHRR